MLAASLKVPGIALTENEAHQLAMAINNVAAYYPIAIDPKMQAWGALFITAGTIYGSRVIASYAEPKKEQPAKPEGGSVSPFRPVA